MSYLALYRKYRPKNFDDVCGQEEIVTVIKNAIVNNKVSHAYLFSGPRGTGKTTIAKIIGRLVNCENLVDGNPCGKCYNCVNFMNSNDIVEIDAASNNGVDEIRELRDKVNLVPNNAKYKVYIIDEVHMLTNQAFNALLKTLEEPPGHVIFILATTEPHKIPLTIASRCQKFRFSKIDENKIVDRLKFIAAQEKVTASLDVFYEIARLSDGCMRDAINIFDQLIAYGNGNVEIEDVYKVNGSVSYDDISLLINYVINGDKVNIIKFISEFEKSGNFVNKFIEELIVFFKDVLLYRNTNVLSNIEVKNKAIIEVNKLCDDNFIYDFVDTLYNVLNSIKTTSHDSIIFMTALLKVSDKFNSNVLGNNDFKEEKGSISSEIISREIILGNNSGKNDNLGDKIVDISSDKSKNVKINRKMNSLSVKDIDIRINNTLALASKNVLNEYKSKWKSVDEYIYDSKYSVAAGLLKDAVIVACSSNYIILCSEIHSVVDRINESYELVEELLGKIYGSDIFVVALTSNAWTNKKKDYVVNIKNGNKYTVIEYSKKKDDDKKGSTPVDELINLVGDSIIEYK